MTDRHTTNTTPAAARMTVEYFVQCQQPDRSWEQASSTTTDRDFAVKRLAALRKGRSDFAFRLAQRTTTVVVKPLPDCLTCQHWICDGEGPCGALLSVSAVGEQRCECPGPGVTQATTEPAT